VYRLYWYPGTCARVPFVALEEIGAPFEAVLEDRMAEQRPEYLLLNPKGSVPTLMIDDQPVTENLAIQTYLARRHPEAKLLPLGDPGTEARLLEMQSWFASSLHPLVRQLRFPRWYTDDPAAHDSLRAKATPQIQRAFTTLDSALADREWLFGDWSIVDVHLLWLWFRATGSGLDGSPFPRLADHAVRCEARPSVSRVLEQEEAQLAALREAGRVPGWVLPFQAGHAPVFAHDPEQVG
jgi:glutathione S-transferase